MIKQLTAIMFVTLALCFLAPAASGGDEKLSKRELSEPTTFNGVWCEGVAFFDASGQMRFCRLARDTELSGNVLPAGSRVHFQPNGGRIDWAFLARDTRLDGHVCRGHGHDFMTAFHSNGELRLCWLPADEVIDGVPCRRAGFWADVTGGSVGVHLSPNQKLTQCEAAQAFTLQGRDFRRGDTVRLDLQGRLKE